jgi:hypoxanthine phosphoribosyltransferase
MSQRTTRRSSSSTDPVLSPRSDLPPGLLGHDRSRRTNTVPELSWAQFDHVVQTLARDILSTFVPDLVVGIAHGGLFVGGALAQALRAPFYPVRISRRSRDSTVVRRGPKLSGAMPSAMKGARVLLVDDVAASGDTLTLASALARKAGARQSRTVTLLCRDEGFMPDWTVLVMDGPLVFPWDYGPVAEDGRFELVSEFTPVSRRRRS